MAKRIFFYLFRTYVRSKTGSHLTFCIKAFRLRTGILHNTDTSFEQSRKACTECFLTQESLHRVLFDVYEIRRYFLSDQNNKEPRTAP